MTAIAVDWSGAKNAKGKIWLAVATRGRLTRLHQVRTREEAVKQLIIAMRADSNSVTGLDFAFSLPAWFLAQCAFGSAGALWAAAERHGEQWLRECEPPFWGLPGKRKPETQEHYRRTELRISGQASPKSCFQIGGAGAVGKGSIRGMPFLNAMREAGCSVWPFDAPRLPLVVEIYPRILTGKVNKTSHDERRRYLKREWARQDAGLLELAGGSEDAFDAAVSALVMERHFNEFRDLSVGDDVAKLEGEIWLPGAVSA